jgi:hypothetical protein
MLAKDAHDFSNITSAAETRWHEAQLASSLVAAALGSMMCCNRTDCSRPDGVLKLFDVVLEEVYFGD